MGLKGPDHWFIRELKDLQAVAQEPQGFRTEVIDGGIDLPSNLNVKASQTIISDQSTGLNVSPYCVVVCGQHGNDTNGYMHVKYLSVWITDGI